MLLEFVSQSLSQLRCVSPVSHSPAGQPCVVFPINGSLVGAPASNNSGF